MDRKEALERIANRMGDAPLGLTSADLKHADLAGVILSGANLTSVMLRGANLTSANLSGADLSEADLSGADLRKADLEGARAVPTSGYPGARRTRPSVRNARVPTGTSRNKGVMVTSLRDGWGYDFATGKPSDVLSTNLSSPGSNQAQTHLLSNFFRCAEVLNG